VEIFFSGVAGISSFAIDATSAATGGCAYVVVG